MKDTPQLTQWFAAFLPEALHTRRREWLRAAFGAASGFLLGVWLCSEFFGLSAAIHFSGPLAASSVLLFAVSSGALAQPWSILGSYLCAVLIGLGLGHYLGHNLPIASLALALTILLTFPLRCLHPPGGAMAFCMVFAEGPAQSSALAALSAGGALLLWALIYNNLTGVRYPRLRLSGESTHHTRDPLPSARVGFSSDDLDQALEELGGFVDVTRDDLELIVRSTERHALRRSMGDTRASQVMSRDVISASPDMSASQGLRLLTHHHLKALPILDAERKLVGIVSLVDLICASRRPRRFSLFGWRKGPLLGKLMSSPVRSADANAHIVDLIPLLSDRGLHCLPVLDGDELVGIVTQTDLVAALHRALLASVH